MTTALEMVLSDNRLVALVIPRPLSSSSMRVVRSIAPNFRNFVTLAKRWNVWGVLASEGWVEHLEAKQELVSRPTGTALGFARK